MTAPHSRTTAGITINVRVEGTGPPLLFLGGSNFDLSIKAPVFESGLIQHFTVAAADPRGLGQTDQPDGEWSMRDYAQDALDLLDALGWSRVNVLGESFGAMTALHLAALAPTRINRIALSAGAPGGAGGQSYPIHTLNQIGDAQKRARAALEIMDDRFADLAARDPDQSDTMIAARVVSEAVFLGRNNNAVGYPRLLRARAQHDAWDDLPNVTAPTLVLAGRYDQQAPLDRAQNMASALPNAALHIIDGGHSICFAHPDPVAILLKNWT